MSAQIIVSIHCPRTAGTTFNTFLREEYGAANVLRLRALDNDLEAVRARGFKAICGAFPRAYYQPIAESCVFIDWFRNPVAQAISWYRLCYLRGITDPNHYPAYARLFTRQQADGIALGSIESIKGFCNFKSFDNPQSRILGNIRPGTPLTDGHWDGLLRDLDGLAGIGIVERLPDSFQLLSWQNGWRTPCYGRENTSVPAGQGLDLAQAEEALQEWIGYDLQLHEAALKIFDRRFEEAKAAAGSGLWQAARKTERTEPPSAFDRLASLGGYLAGLLRRPAAEWRFTLKLRLNRIPGMAAIRRGLQARA